MTTTSDGNDTVTVTDAADELEAKGFTGQFAAVEDGFVLCYTCREKNPADSIGVQDLIRTEGVSDPDDMTAVAAICCPSCETKGTLVLKYGPEATQEEDEVLRALDDRRN